MSGRRHSQSHRSSRPHTLTLPGRKPAATVRRRRRPELAARPSSREGNGHRARIPAVLIIAFEIIAALAVVSLTSVAVRHSFREMRETRRKETELRSRLMAEAEGRLSRLMLVTQGNNS